jgi:hypothetical protein
VVGVLYVFGVWRLGFDHTIRERYTAFGRQILSIMMQRRAAAHLV